MVNRCICEAMKTWYYSEIFEENESLMRIFRDFRSEKYRLDFQFQLKRFFNIITWFLGFRFDKYAMQHFHVVPEA